MGTDSGMKTTAAALILGVLGSLQVTRAEWTPDWTGLNDSRNALYVERARANPLLMICVTAIVIVIVSAVTVSTTIWDADIEGMF